MVGEKTVRRSDLTGAVAACLICVSFKRTAVNTSPFDPPAFLPRVTCTPVACLGHLMLVAEGNLGGSPDWDCHCTMRHGRAH